MKDNPSHWILLLALLLTGQGVRNARAEDAFRQPFPTGPTADGAAITTYDDNPLRPGAAFQGSQVQFLYAEEQPMPPGVLPEPSNGNGEEEKSLSEQLEELTEKYSELSDDLEELQEKQAELEEEHEGFVVPGSAPTMEVAGRIHLDYWAFPGDSPGVNAFETGDPFTTPQDRFAFRRIRVAVQGELPGDMLYKAETEFAEPNEFEYRDVYIGWDDLPILRRLLIGNQKRPYGLDHLNSSRFNVFIERPFIVEAFNQDARRLGIVSYGVSEDQAYNWRYGVYNMRLTQDEGAYVSDHYQLEFAGRLANTFYYDEASEGRYYGHWAVSSSIAQPDGSAGGDPPTPGFGRAANEARFQTRAEARSTTRWLDTGRVAGAEVYGLLGAEGVVNLGPLQVVSEYMNIWLERNPGFGENLHFHGGYVYLSYFLTGEHVPWDREDGVIGRVEPFRNFYFAGTRPCRELCGWGAWQIAVRWSYANLTDDDIAGGIGESVTAGLNWYWSPNAKLQFNYLYGDIHDHFPVAGQTAGTYHIVGTRFVVDF